MKLAIVGSIKLAGNKEAWQIICDALDRHHPSLVISGGASGIDTMAIQAAKSRGIPYKEFKPAVAAWGAPGGFRDRNKQIANACDRLVRIVASTTTTYGSGYTRDLAARLGKPVENYEVKL